MTPYEFTITEEHKKLAARMYVYWEDGAYYGSPAVDQKRPYGNGDVLDDIVEILEWDCPRCPHCQEHLNDNTKTDERARAIHKEMGVVLQIVLNTGQFDTGKYSKVDSKWKKV